MRNEEITETLTASTDEQLQEELEEATWQASRSHPILTRSPQFLARRAEWAEYRDQVIAEIATRAA
jgi:hypothetical protein